MKCPIEILLITSLLVAVAKGQEENQEMPSIIPTPQQLILKTNRFKFSSGTKIILSSNSKEERFAAEQIVDEFRTGKGAQLKVVGENAIRKLPANYVFIGGPASDYGRRLLKERKGELTPAMKEEGYFLDVDPNGIVIVAESDKGKFYGVMTLLQAVRREKRALVAPGMTVRDYPLEKVRGISDDISRGQVSTLENFKKIIRFLARYKMNTYCPYIEDMFVFKHHPLIGKGRGALTPQEVKELDAYARKYYVEIIPIFETLGHWENILAKPEYVRYAEFPGAHTLNVSDESVYSMLDEMIGELSVSYSSRFFNMAADESWDVGLGVNKERVAKSDLATVHAEHYKRVVDLIRKHGKKPMMYGDIILNNPTILEKIPQDITIVDWHYGASFNYPSPKIFKKAGFPFIASPAVWNFTGPFPGFLNTFVNIRNFNRDGFESGSLGLMTSNWNDYGGEELRELNYYGYAWTAECAWQPLKADVESFDKSFFRNFFGTDNPAPAQSVYTILSSPANQCNWQELWRHPMLPFRPQSRWEDDLPIALRLQSIKSTMPLVFSLIDEVRIGATKNLDQLQYLEFVARLNLWFAKKTEAQEEVKSLCVSIDSAQNKDSVATALVSICDDVAKDLTQLRSEFERLWFSTNRPAGLEYLLMRYDRQAAYWKEKSEEVKRGKFWVEPTIESAWVYHPKGSPGMKDSTQVQKAYFRKTFPAPKGIRTATLQLIGDTYAKVSVNGREAGEVYARRSLSLSLEHQRVKVFDIQSLLADSSNVIAVEARTYSPNGSAGFNLYCELQLSDGTVVKIISDSTWKVSETAGEKWTTASFDDSGWLNAEPKIYPFAVVRPNFAGGRSSWIER